MDAVASVCQPTVLEDSSIAALAGAVTSANIEIPLAKLRVGSVALLRAYPKN